MTRLSLLIFALLTACGDEPQVLTSGMPLVEECFAVDSNPICGHDEIIALDLFGDNECSGTDSEPFCEE